MNMKVLVIALLSAVVFFGCGEAKTAKKTPVKDEKAAKAVEGPIVWVNNLTDGLKLAKSSKKPVMVDFFATWCGWCKKLDKDVYTDKDVIALSKEFVCVKSDTDKYGKDASQYGVQGLPTIVFLNADGTVIDKMVGYSPAADFAAEMKKVLKK